MSSPNEDELEAMMRQAAPAAPAGFTDKVMWRIGQEAARRRRQRMFVGGGAVLAAAAMLLVMMRPRGEVAWTVRSTKGIVSRATGDGLRGGDALVVDEGSARLAALVGGVEVEVMAVTALQVTPGKALFMSRGRVVLHGDGARVETAVGSVTARGNDAAVEVALAEGAGKMRTNVVNGAAGAGMIAAALLSVQVLRGEAEVKGTSDVRVVAPLRLAAGERTLMRTGGTSLTSRNKALREEPLPPAGTPVLPRAPINTMPGRATAQQQVPPVDDQFPPTADAR